MSFPSFSIPEIIRAIETATRIYDAFFDNYDNASARIRDLADTVKYLRDILSCFHALFAQYGGVFPAEASFEKCLEECDAFLKKFRMLRPDNAAQGTGNLQQISRWVWQTARFALADDQAQRLEKRMSLEIQKLVPFILLFAFKRANLGNHVAPSNDRPGLAIPDLSYQNTANMFHFQQSLETLMRIRYTFERETSSAAQGGRDPDYSVLYHNLNEEWRRLCSLVGLTGDRIPSMPPERLLRSPSRQWNEMIVDLARVQPPRNPPMPPRSPSDSISTDNGRETGSSPARSFPAVDTPGTTPSSPAPSRAMTQPSNLDLTRPELQSCIATIKLGNTEELFLWHFDSLNSARILVWERHNHNTTLEHHFPSTEPSKIFPYTKHNSMGEPLHITFNEAHRLLLRNHESVEREFQVQVDYVFVRAEDHKRFQEELREKDLLHKFDFERLWSYRKDTSTYGEATVGDIKIWRDHSHPRTFRLSFFGSSYIKQHLEFPIHWFDHPIAPYRSSKCVRLNFIQPNPSTPNPGSPSTSQSRRFSFSHKSTRSQSISGDATFDEKHYTAADTYRFLIIEFETSEILKAFTTAFESAYKDHFVRENRSANVSTSNT
ncbi:hypothetical protein K432DRAFT_429280 [Lepidopterella palustris CBS 459.81]|uniref:Uncharacterized protein n=1 Tax=Lepidopterella palustris CBS 459.81 TaxID=1314670 RepID=A0A8E2E1T0_9PEZI|nr:hypothetical protein K432DRAFT_429280 [Lepidopterella palustris CBS 459.81]